MAVIARIVVVILGYMLACVAAATVLTLGILASHRGSAGWFDSQGAAISWAIAPAALLIAFIAMLPALLVIVIGEGLALRSSLFYGALGGVLALALTYGLDVAGYVGEPNGSEAHAREVLAASGIAGGLVYWLFAGRRAGSWK